MKKIILGILSFLLITPVFAWDSFGEIKNIYINSTNSGDQIYYALGDVVNKYQGSFINDSTAIFYGFGKLTNSGFIYYDLSGNQVSSVSSYINYNPGIYVYGLNNGYYSISGVPTLNGSLLSLCLGSQGYCTQSIGLGGEFVLGLDSSNVFNGNIFYKYGNDYVLLSSVSSNYNISEINSRLIRFYSSYNLYNYWDLNNFVTNFGSIQDLPSGFSRNFVQPLIDGGYTYSYYTGSTFYFKTIFGSDINYTFYDEFSSVDLSDKNRDYLFLHFNDYLSDYLSGKLTIILKNTNSGVVYNVYPFVKSVNQLSGVNPLRKGYLSGDFSIFTNLYNGITSYFESYGSYSSFLTLKFYTSWDWCSSRGCSTHYGQSINNYQFIEDNSVPKINLIGDNGSNSLTTGNVVDVLDTLCKSSLIKPAFCNGVTEVSTGVDGFWDLDGSGNLIYTLINTDPNNMGWADITSNGSGGFNIVCSDQDGFGCPLLENAGLSGYLDYGSGFILGTDYYETFFQKTGRFFACPYGYVVLDTNSFLKILNKFNQISESIGFDFMLPINCSIAAFTHGKNFKFLKDVDLGLNPLMGHIQGPDDPRVYLYRFFDFLLSIALLFFLLKLYHLIF